MDSLYTAHEDEDKVRKVISNLLQRLLLLFQHDDNPSSSSMRWLTENDVEHLLDLDLDLDLDGVEDSDEYRRVLIQLLQHYEFTSVKEAEWFYFINIMGAMLIIGCVAVIAGLFLGYLTLDAMDLLILQRSSLDEDERKYAAAIYPIVQQRHLLLVTLLMLNALAYEALPLFLDKLVPSWLAIVLSSTLVLLFGEIVPSAIFTGPNQLALGYLMVPLMNLLLFVMYPVAWPCSKLLDHLVHGPDGPDPLEEAYNRGELTALVNIQYEQRQKVLQETQNKQNKRKTIAERKLPNNANTNNKDNDRNKSTTDIKKKKKTHHVHSWSELKQEILETVSTRHEDISLDDKNQDGQDYFDEEVLEQQMSPPIEKQEVDVVVGALQMKTKVATDVYTPLRQCFMVPDDKVLDKQGMTEIYAAGYSRVPVYHRAPRDDDDDDNNNDEAEDDDDDRSRVIGFMMTRQLMMIDWDHERDVKTLPLVRPDAVSPRRNLVHLLKLLRSGGSHMAFVCARPDLANRALQQRKPIPIEAGFMGIVTLEDILESILQIRIYDEVDIRERDRAVGTLTRWAAEKLQRFARRSHNKRRLSATASQPACKSSKSNNNSDDNNSTDHDHNHDHNNDYNYNNDTSPMNQHHHHHYNNYSSFQSTASSSNNDNHHNNRYPSPLERSSISEQTPLLFSTSSDDNKEPIDSTPIIMKGYDAAKNNNNIMKRRKDDDEEGAYNVPLGTKAGDDSIV